MDDCHLGGVAILSPPLPKAAADPHLGGCIILSTPSLDARACHLGGRAIISLPSGVKDNDKIHPKAPPLDLEMMGEGGGSGASWWEGQVWAENDNKDVKFSQTSLDESARDDQNRKKRCV